MKLMLITSTYPTPNSPSQGVFNGQLVAALNKIHSIRVIAPIAWTANSTREKSLSTDLQVLHPTFYYPPRILRWTYGLWYWKSIQSSFRILTKDYTPDVILGYWAHPDSDAAVRAARSLRIPAVVMVGGSDVRILAKSGMRRRAIQAVLQKADRVIAFSEDLARHVSELGVSSDRIDVVYRGVDRSIFKSGDRLQARQELQIESNAVVLVWVGRMVDVKNPSMAIRAAAKWRQQYGDRFRLVMIGIGPLILGLKRLAEQLDVLPSCLFLGSIPHSDIAKWFQAANLTILTSHSEGIPNVLLESVACGTPFVATDVGGVSEVADPRTDKLVPVGDESAFQQAVIEKLADCTDYPRRYSTYDVHGLARRITEILERL